MQVLPLKHSIWIAKNTRGGSKSSTSGVEESNHRSGVATKLKQKRSRSHLAPGKSIDKEKGVRCNGFGRIESWVISGYEEGSPVIWVSTGLAYYDCIKPSYKYRRFYNLFFEKAHACVEVYRKLSRTYGGNSNIGVDELIAGVARAMSTTKKNDQMFTGLPVLVALREEKKKFESFLTSEAATSGIVGNTSLKVVEESADQSTSTTCGLKKMRI
ncbi:hypothetical protein GH714_006443 [Hevea brasiliensis]|uniref:RFTS domain-containing protein n=1 Tax=Hevea brasiliensis TaxID=3981 RepID=A0A6A6KZQ0_HEVBR|nr:hypothetical protein GH714_006443 [Hevea brasiliensis]